MLRAAKTDALRSEQLGLFGVARNVRVGAHAEVAAKLVGPFHEGSEVMRLRIRLTRFGLAQVDFAGAAVERNPIAFFHNQLLAVGRDRGDLLRIVNRNGRSADYTGTTHAARHYRRMACQAADRRQNALRNIHAVNIIRRSFLADQNDWTLARKRYRVIGRKRGASHRSAW